MNTSQIYLKKWSKNLIIFFLSIIFAFTLFFLSKDSTIFQASILWIQDIQKIQENQRDVAYKESDWILDIFVSDIFLQQNYSSIDITILYDYQNLIINTQDIQSPKDYTTSYNQSWLVSFSFYDLQDINSQESLLIIPFSWSMNNILISNAAASKWSEEYSLSIGNLSEYTQH